MVRSKAAGSVERTMPPGAMPAFAITTSMPAEALDRALDGARQRVRVGHVALEPGGVRAALGRDSRELLGLQADQGDVRASRSDPARGLGPESAGGTRDEHCLSARRPVHAGTLTWVASGHGRST